MRLYDPFYADETNKKHFGRRKKEKDAALSGPETRSAPWPEFSIQGRTPKSLLRLVSAWSLTLEGAEVKGFSWGRSGIPAYRYVDRGPGEADSEWSIVELLNSGAPHAEGRAMCRCVYTYANKCRSGESTIWPLRLRTDGHEKRMATIEASPRQRAIVQVRARHNRPPGKRSSEIIRNWAAWAGLHVRTRLGPEAALGGVL